MTPSNHTVHREFFIPSARLGGGVERVLVEVDLLRVAKCMGRHAQANKHLKAQTCLGAVAVSVIKPQAGVSQCPADTSEAPPESTSASNTAEKS